MEKRVFRVTIITYLVSVTWVMYLVFNPSTDVPTEVLSYMQWWYTQPLTGIETFTSYLGFIALLVSFVGAIALLFLKQWAAYLFIFCITIVTATEWLVPGYAPRSSLDANLDSIASISIGVILAMSIFSRKLEIFEHNK